MKYYFAGSIRGGRDKADTYVKINELLEKNGTVLDKHVASNDVFKLESNNSEEEIYNRDINWIKECDMVIAEISVPSIGVGYEIAYAESLNKKIICLCDEKTNASAMIAGNKNIELIKYSNEKELLNKLEKRI